MHVERHRNGKKKQRLTRLSHNKSNTPMNETYRDVCSLNLMAGHFLVRLAKGNGKLPAEKSEPQLLTHFLFFCVSSAFHPRPKKETSPLTWDGICHKNWGRKLQELGLSSSSSSCVFLPRIWFVPNKNGGTTRRRRRRRWSGQECVCPCILLRLSGSVSFLRSEKNAVRKCIFTRLFARLAEYAMPRVN